MKQFFKQPLEPIYIHLPFFHLSGNFQKVFFFNIYKNSKFVIQYFFWHRFCAILPVEQGWPKKQPKKILILQIVNLKTFNIVLNTKSLKIFVVLSFNYISNPLKNKNKVGFTARAMDRCIFYFFFRFPSTLFLLKMK